MESLSALSEDLMYTLVGKELYGFQIVKAFEEASLGRRSLAIGSLYTSLRKLEERGFVISRWGDKDGDNSAARRRYYVLTPSGVDALAKIRVMRQKLVEWVPA